MTDALAPPPLSLDTGDLAELMTSFNEVTARLHETHDRLHSEVARLRSQLDEANEQLQRSRRLAALGHMAAGIAHEVRNPLGSIRLYARMLEDDLAAMPEQRQVASRILHAVSGLDGIVGDVLNFAREIEPRPAFVGAEGLIRGALEAALGPGVRDIGIEVCGEGEVFCDPALMRQVLVNLVRNSIEAMEGRSRRVLRVGVERRADAGEAVDVLFVADTGTGIEEGAIEHIFNPFYTTRHSGSGLGLAIVHRIVDAHAGRIVTRSRTKSALAIDSEATGTTIEMHLPRPGVDDR